jgi:prepilin-type N-terminal cleavage/methylation domain-containing protein
MTTLHSRTIRRQAFTLVELMIVIAIIALLIAMLVAAVVKALATGNKVKLTNEIRQFSTAMENFKARFGAYPPSRIILCESYNDYFVGGNPANSYISPLHADSVAFINQMFPRINWYSSVPPSGPNQWTASGGGIDWNGSGVKNVNGVVGPDAPVLLEGDQCLVFFLGGIPSAGAGTPSCNGFSTTAQNPAYHIFNGGDIIAPFFDFQSNRLTTGTGSVYSPASFVYKSGTAVPPQRSPFHYAYLDTYGATPYAYFSSFQQRNNYNTINYPTSANKAYYDLLRVAPAGKLGTSDCTSLNVWPYAETLTNAGTVQFLNPNSYQIISAGPDGVFGRGTDLNILLASPPTGDPLPWWTKTSAGNVGATSVSWDYSTPANTGAGLDDQSNFYGSALGVPGGT